MCVFLITSFGIHFMYSLGYFSNNPEPACPDSEAWTLMKFLLLILVCSESVKMKSHAIDKESYTGYKTQPQQSLP